MVMARRDLDSVRRAAAAVKKSRERLADAMLNAQKSGETVGDIAKAAGLGRSRAFELIAEARQRRG